MHKLKNLYNILAINHKLENQHIRLLYLKDVWGMEQTLIGECENHSQSYVSRELIAARKLYSREQLVRETYNMWSLEEIKYLHFMPREIIADVPVLAFINNILGVFPIHPFFDHFDHSPNVRIAALATLGIQNKRLMEVFNKNQPTISMIVKRSARRAKEIERSNRYDDAPNYRLVEKPMIFGFTKAGGMS